MNSQQINKLAEEKLKDLYSSVPDKQSEAALNEAFNRGYTAAKEDRAGMKWVSVKERLPKKDLKVFCLHEDSGNRFVSWYTNDCNTNEEKWYEGAQPTHWLEEKTDNLNQDPIYVYGNLVWKDGQDSTVEFKPSKNQDEFSNTGRWKIALNLIGVAPSTIGKRVDFDSPEIKKAIEETIKEQETILERKAVTQEQLNRMFESPSPSSQSEDIAVGFAEWKDKHCFDKKKVGEQMLYFFIGEVDEWLTLSEVFKKYKLSPEYNSLPVGEQPLPDGGIDWDRLYYDFHSWHGKNWDNDQKIINWLRARPEFKQGGFSEQKCDHDYHKHAGIKGMLVCGKCGNYKLEGA